MWQTNPLSQQIRHSYVNIVSASPVLTLYFPSPSEEMLLLLPLCGPSSSVEPPGPGGKSSSRECTSPRPHDDGVDRERCRGLCAGDKEAPPRAERGAGSGFSLESWRKEDNANIVIGKGLGVSLPDQFPNVYSSSFSININGPRPKCLRSQLHRPATIRIIKRLTPYWQPSWLFMQIHQWRTHWPLLCTLSWNTRPISD